MPLKNPADMSQMERASCTSRRISPQVRERQCKYVVLIIVTHTEVLKYFLIPVYDGYGSVLSLLYWEHVYTDQVENDNGHAAIFGKERWLRL